MTDTKVAIFCGTVTVFILVFTIVYTVRCTCNKEHFEPVDNKTGYNSGVKVPDISATNVTITSDFNVKTPMKMYNGETETLTLDNTTGDITGNKFSLKSLIFNDFNILDIIYPVGCVYTSFENKNPKDLYGFGTWEPLNDVFLFAGKNTSKGGSKQIKVDNLPKHSHTATSTSSAVSDHNHGYKGPSNKNGYPDGHDDVNNGGAWHEQYWAGNRWGGNNETSSNAGGHNHTITTTIGETGSGADYMPPYQTVYMWRRIADPVSSTTPAESSKTSSNDATTAKTK